MSGPTVLTSAGEIPRVLFGGSDLVVMFDLPSWIGGGGMLASYSPGASRGIQLRINPSVMQRFTLIGFSTQVRMAVAAASGPVVAANGGAWARFGDLWAGLYVNAPLPNTNDVFNPQVGAAFPPDLSTFAKIWDGSSDPVQIYDATTPRPLDPYSQLIASNTMLPAPVQIAPSSNVGFGLVLTPSLMTDNVKPTIVSCSYSVLYTVENVDYGLQPPAAVR